jgi:hypothetical protein
MRDAAASVSKFLTLVPDVFVMWMDTTFSSFFNPSIGGNVIASLHHGVGIVFKGI